MRSSTSRASSRSRNSSPSLRIPIPSSRSSRRKVTDPEPSELKRNLLIEASAGTGKTQALGKRLIALQEIGVRPQEIVALTFSRAAAGEIFERYVSLLAQRVEAERAGQTPSHRPAATMLREVLATQHLSQIGTLDSFLMRIVRAFPRELGLTGELEMMDDYRADRERARVSFAILRRTDARLKKAFVEAFSLAMNQEDVRSFVASYRAFVAGWHDLLAARPDASAWGDPQTIWGRDPKYVHVTARELDHAAARVEATFPGDPMWGAFAAWVRAFRGSFGTPKGYEKILLDADDTLTAELISFTYRRKTVALTREQTLAVQEALECVFGYVIRQKLELARGVHRLVSAFEAEYAKRVRAEGRLVFADVPRLLARLPEEKRLDIEFRMDARLKAWALDEFQDTSREQWAALANLLDEAKQSTDGKSVFVVGDTKQAIYGWRNGDVGIFAREKASGLYALDDLTKTHRSGPAVVEAVNRVFAQGRIRDEFPGWTCPRHETAKPDLPGYVRVMDAPGRRGEDFVGPVYSALAATLGEKADDPRRRGLAAAVLVRGNDFGQLLAGRLKALGLEGVVWEGESDVLDTPALSGFLDLVQLADHPGDALAYRHFRMTPLAAARYPQGVPDAAALSAEMAQAFTTRGLVRTLRELRATLPADPSTAWSVFTEERYTEMLRAAGEFELAAEPGRRLSDFASFLKAKRRRTIAEDGKIKIMTIHRSKGLGFDYVVLPLYEPKPLVQDPTGPLLGESWLLPDPGARVARADSAIGDARRRRTERAEQEALCGYYVAMTRAKRAMMIVCQPAATSAGAKLHFSDLVRSAGIGELGDSDAPLRDAAAVSASGPSCSELPPPPRAPRRRCRRRLPSLRFQSGMSAGSLFASADARREAMARGTAAHKAMESVAFSAELPKPEGFVELWRERAFEVLADGEWISGRFDRVTFFRTAEGLCAEIVDFKSSLAHPERYDGQLGAYRRAVHVLTGIPMDRISARLVAV